MPDAPLLPILALVVLASALLRHPAALALRALLLLFAPPVAYLRAFLSADTPLPATAAGAQLLWHDHSYGLFPLAFWVAPLLGLFVLWPAWGLAGMGGPGKRGAPAAEQVKELAISMALVGGFLAHYILANWVIDVVGPHRTTVWLVPGVEVQVRSQGTWLWAADEALPTHQLRCAVEEEEVGCDEDETGCDTVYRAVLSSPEPELAPIRLGRELTRADASRSCERVAQAMGG